MANTYNVLTHAQDKAGKGKYDRIVADSYEQSWFSGTTRFVKGGKIVTTYVTKDIKYITQGK